MEKRKLKKWEKSNGKIWRDKKRDVQDESDTADKNIVEGVIQKWLVFIGFIRENLSKVANLDQKTCKKKTIKGKLGKDSSSLHKINKCKLSKVSKVVYFK